MIHVVSNPATGFFLEFKRNYDFQFTRTKYTIIPLGQVSDRVVVDGATSMTATRDTTARDRLESSATVVSPPGRSANPFDPAAPNCQNWIFDFIERLIAESYIDASVRGVLQGAPLYL